MYVYLWLVLILFSQSSPSYPSTQVQVYILTASEQLPPFSHGLDAHSSISARTNYKTQFQKKYLYLWIVFILFSQSSPSYPSAQVQVYIFVPSVQVPEFWHGLLAHSSISARTNNKI